ncbi:hypothetical protein OS493_036584 [Desmophyllum pertusum]|uniref:Ig-like domain-containing protein n=1 Tax=Desmophyllum pertusum TaxID=174260 RepID=A0A9X0D7N0_9CNID|nr:hypothetical protein OS493_036584 [Desmophyllum pertusum]
MGTTTKILPSTSIFPTSSSRFHLSPVEMASVTRTCKNCNDFSLLMSSSLNERPPLSSMSYSIGTGLGSLSSMVLSSSLNERPSLSSMSYSIDPHTTTGPASPLSSMVLSSSLNERPSLSSKSYSIDPTTTGPASSLSSMAKLVPNADCSKTCVKGTLNAACDACTCENHVLTGRVQTKNDAPLSEAKISLAETPYNVLAQTNASGFFIAFNVCADANQELLISREGFVPVKIKATIMTSTTASLKAKLDNAVPPSITVHPRSKMRISGHGVTLCCDGDGTPTPEFEWFKDNNIIDKDVYHYNKTLEISDAVEDVTITCGGSVTFKISKVARCGCQACEVPKSYITGVVVGVKSAVEKPIAYCEIIIGDHIYNADDKGSFTFKVPDDKQRLSVVLRTHLTKNMQMLRKVKPTPKPFNSSESFKVPLGDSHVDSAFAEIEIPEDALLKEDGTIYSGQANLRLSLMDPRNASDVMTAPGDFSTIDEDGEEQMLVTYGMLTLDLKMTVGISCLRRNPEKLNISVDSNGNTTTKLWWLDVKTGRWIEAGSLWMETNETSRSKRSPRRFLVTEITPVIQKQTFNIDVKENFGAVRVSAPMGSTVRILCKEPTVETYAGYVEGVVDGFGVTCISVWIDRECFMQAESRDARFLNPSDPDSFPDSVSVSIVNSNLQSLGSSPDVESFSFNIKTDSKGPVYPHYDEDVQNCREPQLVFEHRQFEFALPAAPVNLNLISQRPRPDVRDPLNWFPPGITVNCFIKIVISGSKGSIFLASSYRAYKKDEASKFGVSVAMAEPATDIDNAFVVCLEVRCPGEVWHEDTSQMVPEWTHVIITHLTGTCYFQKNYLQKQDNIDNNGATCPCGPNAGAENGFCIPLPAGTFDIDGVYTANRNDRQKGVNRCNVETTTGNQESLIPLHCSPRSITLAAETTSYFLGS